MTTNKQLLANMITLFAEGNQQKAKDVFHSYTQQKMRQVVEAMTGKDSNFTDADTRKLAGVTSLEDAKKVVGQLIGKCKSSKAKKERFSSELERCTTVAKCQRLGYNILLSGEGMAVKEGVEDSQQCSCIERIDQIDPNAPHDEIVKSLISIATDTPEITVADINDLLSQIEGASGEEALEIAKQVFSNATQNDQDEMCSESDDMSDMEDQDAEHLTGEDINDEEFEELDLPEAVQDALDGIEDEDVRERVEDVIIEFFESGMDEGELEDQIEDFNHLVTSAITKCQDECDQQQIDEIVAGLDSVKVALFGDQCDHCEDDSYDSEDTDGEDAEIEPEQQPDRKFGDLVSAKRIGVGSM